MTAWRRPTTAEVEHDRRQLATFLDLALAAEIAAIPVIDFAEQVSPLALRCDAWMWRTSQLFTTELATDEVAA